MSKPSELERFLTEVFSERTQDISLFGACVIALWVIWRLLHGI